MDVRSVIEVKVKVNNIDRAGDLSPAFLLSFYGISKS
jgi:hypothetical protein